MSFKRTLKGLEDASGHPQKRKGEKTFRHGRCWKFLAKNFNMKGSNCRGLMLGTTHSISSPVDNIHLQDKEKSLSKKLLNDLDKNSSQFPTARYTTYVFFTKSLRPSGTIMESQPWHFGSTNYKGTNMKHQCCLLDFLWTVSFMGVVGILIWEFFKELSNGRCIHHRKGVRKRTLMTMERGMRTFRPFEKYFSKKSIKGLKNFYEQITRPKSGLGDCWSYIQRAIEQKSFFGSRYLGELSLVLDLYISCFVSQISLIRELLWWYFILFCCSDQRSYQTKSPGLERWRILWKRQYQAFEDQCLGTEEAGGNAMYVHPWPQL